MSTITITPEESARLVALVNEAAPGTALTIELAPGLYAVDSLVMNTSVTLVGAPGGHSVLTSHDDRGLVKVCGRGTHVTLRSLTFRKGLSDEGGGLEVSNDCRVLVDDCTFVECSAFDTKGGAIDVDGDSELIVTRSSFLRCRAPWGGAVAAAGNARVVLDRCLFIGNEGDHGGGVFAADRADVSVRSSTFLDNSAHDAALGGGSLLVSGTASYGPGVTVVNSVFVGEGALLDNPDRVATLRIASTLVPPGGLARLRFDDGGGNVEATADLVEVASGLYALRQGGEGSDGADVRLIPEGALDLLGEPLVMNGQAPLGALAGRGRREVGQFVGMN
jgi:hypothetical protein